MKSSGGFIFGVSPGDGLFIGWSFYTLKLCLMSMIMIIPFLKFPSDYWVGYHV